MDSTPVLTLTPARRRALLARSVARGCISAALLVFVYFAAPLTGAVGWRTLMGLAVGVVAFVAMLVWQLRRIRSAAFPQLRAAEAVIVSVALSLVIFAAGYLRLSNLSPSSFSEPLSHTSALYFSVTTFATVGFGDITARSDLARSLVSVQMLLDLVVLGVVVRVFFETARTTSSQLPNR